MAVAFALVCLTVLYEACLCFVPRLRLRATLRRLNIGGSDLHKEDVEDALAHLDYGDWLLIHSWRRGWIHGNRRRFG